MGLFKKKPGGTLFGNLLRAGTAKLAPGILGTGADRIEIGQTKTNAQLAAEAGGETVGSEMAVTLFGDTRESKTVMWVMGGLIVLLGGFAAYMGGLFKTSQKYAYGKGKRK